MSRECPICGCKIGFFTKSTARDGIICYHCAQITLAHDTKSIEDIKEYWKINEERKKKFTKTQELHSFSIDHEHKLFAHGLVGAKVHLIYYYFDEIENYKVKKINGKDKIVYVNMQNFAGKSQLITTPTPSVLAFFDECIMYKRATKRKASVSTANEILRYKKLLDMGIITETEFELKKKQLLDL